ncbi:MAG: sporulation transcriptional regulator SpoIIID [Clostridia bacterium]|nr:sporulation transcriptional regulator SpoIIID [Clostridia bacterium]
MKDYIADRVCEIAKHMLDTKCTVRSAASKFGVSKSTVHKDISERLKFLSPSLFAEIKKLLETNKQERHIRGGIATRLKYKNSQRYFN